MARRSSLLIAQLVFSMLRRWKINKRTTELANLKISLTFDLNTIKSLFLSIKNESWRSYVRLRNRKELTLCCFSIKNKQNNHYRCQQSMHLVQYPLHAILIKWPTNFESQILFQAICILDCDRLSFSGWYADHHSGDLKVKALKD